MQSPGYRRDIASMLYGALGMLALLSGILAIKILLFSRKPRSGALTEHQQLPVAPALLPESQPSPGPTHMGMQDAGSNRRKRLLTMVAAPALVALVAAIFLLSVRSYSQGLSGTSATPVKTNQLALVRPDFERGIIYPQWSPAGYGDQDVAWQEALGTVKTKTGAQWIEIPILFSQATSTSTTVEVSQSTSGVQAFIQGIEKAHSLGYKVFFVPLMQVREPGGWSGSITFKTAAQEQAWFDGYWHTIQPYVMAAANEHVEQMAIATELQTLQQIVPDPFWNQLISRIRSIFKGTLTYDMNWSSLGMPMPAWLKNPALTYIGVSTYIPLVDQPVRVDPKDMQALWREKIKPQLDALAAELGKQVLISEIGYRNSADALYRTWEATSKALPDPAEQAGAYAAALSNVYGDTHIAGIFFWGWDNVGMFAIAGQPAAQVLLKWYTLKQS